MKRRTLLAGGVGLAAAAGLEWASLMGRFDHRTAAAAKLDDATWKSALGNAAKAPGGAVVHVGHSTHVLVTGGKRFLTDPWFFDPAFGALAHGAGPAVRPESIGELEGILISHEHPDHFDLAGLDRLDKSATVIVATAEQAAQVRPLGFEAVEHLEAWKTVELGGVEVHTVPALHDVPQIGFVVGPPDGASMYFAGDSALHPDLVAIRERFSPRLAILPVDGLRVRTQPLAVMGPAEALEAARRLGVATVVPSHADAKFTDPIAEHLIAVGPLAPIDEFDALVSEKAREIRCRALAPGGVATI